MRKALPILFFTPLLLIAQNMDEVIITSQKLTDKVYFLKGRGGNIGVLIDGQEVIMVDDQYAPLAEKIKTAITELVGLEVSYVINTHYHGDHTGGNENFKNGGAKIVAHPNVKDRLGMTFENVYIGRTMEAKSEAFWPDMTIEEFEQTSAGKEMDIIHVPNAHTDGDIMIFFRRENVLHAGDAFVRYGYPFIDVSAGGSIDGIIAAQEKIIEMINGDTQIIPGHGELASVSDVKELLDMLQETKAIVRAAKEKGTSLEDLIPQKPLAAYHERWSGNFINSDLFVQLIYESL